MFRSQPRETKSGRPPASWPKFPALRINRTLNGGRRRGRAFRLTKSVNALLTFGELHGPGESWSANSASPSPSSLLPVSPPGKVSRATRKSPHVTWSYSDHVNRVTDKPTWTSVTTSRGLITRLAWPTTDPLPPLETSRRFLKLTFQENYRTCGNVTEASTIKILFLARAVTLRLTNLALSRVDVMVRTGLKVVQRVGEGRGGGRRKREITNPWTRERDIYIYIRWIPANW